MPQNYLENKNQRTMQLSERAPSRRTLQPLELPTQMMHHHYSSNKTPATTPTLPKLRVLLEKNKLYKGLRGSTPRTLRVTPSSTPVRKSKPLISRSMSEIKVMENNSIQSQHQVSATILSVASKNAKLSMTNPAVNSTTTTTPNVRTRSETDPGKYMNPRKRRRGAYKCGKCGGPKKNHVCPLEDDTNVLRRQHSFTDSNTSEE